MRIAYFFPMLLIIVSAFACVSHDKSNANAEIPDTTFSSIQKAVFHESCSAPSCHGSGAKGGLSLLAGESYTQLAGVPSTLDKKNFPPFLRVKPGHPDSSFLLVKLTAPDSSQGEIMPKGSDRLSRSQIDAIRRWILAGAPNN